MVLTVNTELITNKKEISRINEHLQETLELFKPQKGLFWWKLKIGLSIIIFLVLFLNSESNLMQNLGLIMFAHLPLLVCLQWAIYIQQANRIVNCWIEYVSGENFKEPQLKTLYQSYQKLLSIIELMNSSFKFSTKIIYFNLKITPIITIYLLVVIFNDENQQKIGEIWRHSVFCIMSKPSQLKPSSTALTFFFQFLDTYFLGEL